MQDLFDTSSAWLDRQFRAHASRRVTYQRAEATVCVPATIGRTNREIDQGDGPLVRFESRDYLIDVADLVLDGQLIEPAVGDRVIEGDRSDGTLFVVMEIPGESCWRYTDQFRRRYRIHAKYVGRTPEDPDA